MWVPALELDSVRLQLPPPPPTTPSRPRTFPSPQSPPSQSAHTSTEPSWESKNTPLLKPSLSSSQPLCFTWRRALCSGIASLQPLATTGAPSSSSSASSSSAAAAAVADLRSAASEHPTSLCAMRTPAPSSPVFPRADR